MKEASESSEESETETCGANTKPLFDDEEDDSDDSEQVNNDEMQTDDSDDSEPMDDEVGESTDSSDDDDDVSDDHDNDNDDVCRTFQCFILHWHRCSSEKLCYKCHLRHKIKTNFFEYSYHIV